ncbi:hypothetical protein [Mariniluteicoccus flavus]
MVALGAIFLLLVALVVVVVLVALVIVVVLWATRKKAGPPVPGPRGPQPPVGWSYDSHRR